MTDYDFIDPDTPERRRAVQRRIEMKDDIENYHEVKRRSVIMSGRPMDERKSNNKSNTDKGGVDSSVSDRSLFMKVKIGVTSILRG